MEIPLKLAGRDRVVLYKNNIVEKPLVSVSVVTYKHEQYIKQCLDGILMQKTNFEFEILLGEDDSPDKTREICIEYANKFPKKIRLFLHDRSNVIYINGSPTGRYNSLYNLTNARGKYIALCEGDDYWTDPLKLQKQVDFLEKNEDVGLVHSDFDWYFVKGNKMINNYYKSVQFYFPLKYNVREYLDRPLIRTMTVLFRAKNMIGFWDVVNSRNWLSADFPLFCYVSKENLIGYIDESLGVYRRGLETASSNESIRKKYEFGKNALEIRYFFYNLLGYKDEIILNNLKMEYLKIEINYNLISNNYKQLLNLLSKESIKNKFLFFIVLSNILISLIKGKFKSVLNLL